MKVAESKTKIVSEFVKLMEEYPIIGTVNMENLPAKQLQNIKSQIRGGVIIRMGKRRLLKIAIDKVSQEKKGIQKLKDNMPGMPAMLFTTENPFILYKKISMNKSTAPAKAGQTAPKDIIIPAGSTNFSPGPIIGELGMFKIKTSIVDGKVAIQEDSVVARPGDIINSKLAEILARLGIEPMEIGLDITAIYEDGDIYTKDVLAVDEEQYINDLKTLATGAFNLAVFVSYPCDETAIALLRKAQNDAFALAMSEGILTDATAKKLLGKAQNQAKIIEKLIVMEDE